jgi:hypothetical protein
MKTTKIEESAKYLSCCGILESETHFLYRILTKKLDPPQLRNITSTIANETLKHSKIIQELLKPIPGVTTNFNQCNKDFKNVFKEISKFSGELTSLDSISDGVMPDLLNELANLEDCLYNFYSVFLDSPMHKQFANLLSSYSMAIPETSTFIFECLKENKRKQREMLIEGLNTFYERQVRNKDTVSFIKYKNPNEFTFDQIRT